MNLRFPLNPPQNKDGRILYIRVPYKQKNTYHFNSLQLQIIASCRLSVLLFKWTCSCSSIQSPVPEIN